MAERKKAVALRYDTEKEEAPRLIAKGSGELADKIIEVAREKNIPVVEDRELTEALLRVDIYEEIPPVLYEAVAKVLVFVSQVKRRVSQP